MHCGFLVFDGFSNMVLASAIEPLRAARDYGGSFSWQLISITGRPVTSSSGLSLRCDGGLAELGRSDALFVVAGYGARDHARPEVVKILQMVARRIPVLGGLDSGGWLLAAAGLLSGHRATVHWQDLSTFAEDHLDIDVVNDRYVIDRNRITAGGATTVIDLMLRLIAEQGGDALAFDVSNMFVYDARPRTLEGRGARGLSISKRQPQLIKAVDAMRTNIEDPLPLEQIAASAAVSPRTLARLFERELGVSPGRYYQRIRLDTARALVEETMLLASEIAARTGFESSACLSRAYAAFFGHTVREARKRRRAPVRSAG